jgi:poly-gamma-glutamate synthesis protein (capsule biosynthesis protein)
MDGGKRVAVIGCLEPCRSRGPRIFKQEEVALFIDRIRSDFDFIYVYPHWGMEGEYTRYPSPMPRKLARRWIDVGADGVIGNHAHVPQGMEYYCGKPIYYCIGNFDFPLGETDSCPESRERMKVIVDDGGTNRHVFGDEETEAGFKSAITILNDEWTLWKWAKTIGPENLKKNTASWRIRLRKNLVKTLPKFLAWQLLPKTLLFRAATLFR